MDALQQINTHADAGLTAKVQQLYEAVAPLDRCHQRQRGPQKLVVLPRAAYHGHVGVYVHVLDCVSVSEGQRLLRLKQVSRAPVSEDKTHPRP
jgi:hypothetical protein